MVAFYNYGDHMNADARIQHQTRTGNWIEVSQVPNDPQNVLEGMDRVQALYPGSRVRAVDQEDRVIDILT